MGQWAVWIHSCFRGCVINQIWVCLDMVYYPVLLHNGEKWWSTNGSVAYFQTQHVWYPSTWIDTREKRRWETENRVASQCWELGHHLWSVAEDVHRPLSMACVTALHVVYRSTINGRSPIYGWYLLGKIPSFEMDDSYLVLQFVT